MWCKKRWVSSLVIDPPCADSTPFQFPHICQSPKNSHKSGFKKIWAVQIKEVDSQLSYFSLEAICLFAKSVKLPPATWPLRRYYGWRQYDLRPYTVQYTILFSVQCDNLNLCIVHYTPCFVLYLCNMSNCTLYFVHYTPCTIFCAMWPIEHIILYTILNVLFSVQCDQLYILFCTLHSVVPAQTMAEQWQRVKAR